MKEANKGVLHFFIFCTVLLFCNQEELKAGSITGSDNPLYYLSPGEPYTDKPKTTAACMNFGDQLGFGQITLGLRGGLCTLFDPGSIGYGFGAELRIRLSKRYNLECYSDYFQTPIMNLGYRHAICSGVNILYYWTERPMRPYKLTPFLLGGLSYDNNDIRSHSIYTAEYQNWSPWLNLGVGEHYLFSPRFDFTFELYYAIPLGVHPNSFLTNELPVNHQIVILPYQILNVRDEGAFHWGGLFAIISFNYTFGNVK